jgi:hypothetical protein
MPRLTRSDVTRLVIAYQAFCEARDSTTADRHNRANSMAVWGTMLLDAQAKTGIEMHSPELLKRIIADCNEALS